MNNFRVAVSSLIFALGALSAATGCSSMPQTIQKPDVALESLNIQKATLMDATVMLKLAVRNPNNFNIPLDALKYGLNLNGKPFASGQAVQSMTLPANGETEISVPLRMSYLDLYSQFQDVMKNPKTAYQIIGTVTSHNRDFPFEHSGEVKLPTTTPNT